MAGKVAAGDEDQLMLTLGPLQNLFIPQLPLHRIVRMHRQIGRIVITQRALCTTSGGDSQ
jgi:hypothetical protein